MAGLVDLNPLAQRLRELGYVEENVRRQLGIAYPDDIGLVNRTPVLERLRLQADELSLVLRLFWLEADEPLARVRRVLGTPVYEAALAQRLLRVKQGSVQTRLRAEACGNLLVWADRRFRGFDRGGLGLGGDDPVYPPSSDSLMLAEVVSFAGGAEVLDLCTGSGVLALKAAAQAQRVVAVDLSPRAVATARLNARVNEVDNLEVVQGNLYGAVGGRQFDVIIANPPFVSSPYSAGPGYHAGGASGDRVLRRVVAGWSKHLRPAGRAFAISHVGLRQDQSLEDVARGWLAKFRGRAELVVLEKGSAVDLAAAQALFALEHGTPAYAAEVQRWLAYLRRHRIVSVVAFILVAENSAVVDFQVVDATPRVLPLPFSKPAKQHVDEWLGPTAVDQISRR